MKIPVDIGNLISYMLMCQTRDRESLLATAIYTCVAAAACEQGCIQYAYVYFGHKERHLSQADDVLIMEDFPYVLLSLF